MPISEYVSVPVQSYVSPASWLYQRRQCLLKYFFHAPSLVRVSEQSIISLIWSHIPWPCWLCFPYEVQMPPLQLSYFIQLIHFGFCHNYHLLWKKKKRIGIMRNFSRAPSQFPYCYGRASAPSGLIRHVGYSHSLRSSFLRAIVICFNYGGYSSSLPFSWVLVFPPSIPYSLDFFFNSPKLALLHANALTGRLVFWCWAGSHQASEMPTTAKLPAFLHTSDCGPSFLRLLSGLTQASLSLCFSRCGRPFSQKRGKCHFRCLIIGLDFWPSCL